MNLMDSIAKPARDFFSADPIMTKISRPGFTTWAIAGFIVLNMVTAPIITLFDKKTPPKERTYSAERQFFQELLVLVSHLTIATTYKKMGLKLGSLIVPEAYQAASKANPEKVFNLSKGLFFGKPADGWEAANAINDTVRREIRNATTESFIPHIKRKMVDIDPFVLGSGWLGETLGSITATAIVGPFLNNKYLTPFLKGVDKVLNKVSGGRISLNTESESAVASAPQSPALLKTVTTGAVTQPMPFNAMSTATVTPATFSQQPNWALKPPAIQALPPLRISQPLYSS